MGEIGVLSQEGAHNSGNSPSKGRWKMPGDVKIGGGGSCLVHARVGDKTGQDRENPIHIATLLDNCAAGPKTLTFTVKKAGGRSERLTSLQERGLTLSNGEWLEIHWD
jgi:hypothetical protein